MSQDILVTKTLIGQADDLAAAHEHFTEQYVTAGRMALYELLGQMLVLINNFELAIDREDLMAKIKYRLRTEFGIKTQKNSSDIAVLIRYMTRTDRKTAHVYTRVIESAKASGVTPAQLPSFIEDSGGVERIRSLAASGQLCVNEDDTAERDAITKEYLSCRSELPLASFEATEFLDQFGSPDTAYAYFVCSRKGDGKFHVLSPLPSTARFEKLAIDHLSEFVCKDKAAAIEGVARLRRLTNEAIQEQSASVVIQDSA